MNKKVLIIALYCTALLVANITASRIGHVGSFTFSGTPAAYIMCFLLCDVVNENYGKQAAKELIRAGFAALVFYLFFIYSTYFIPAACLEFDTSFKAVFNSSWRVVAASLAAYLVANRLDVEIFDVLRKRKKSKIVRKTVSTVFSQAVDSAVFGIIAFAGTLTWQEIISIFASEYCIKGTINILESPLFCLLTRRRNAETEKVQN